MSTYNTIDNEFVSHIGLIMVNAEDGDHGYVVVYPSLGVMVEFASGDVDQFRVMSMIQGLNPINALASASFKAVKDVNPTNPEDRADVLRPIDFSRFTSVAVADTAGGHIRGDITVNYSADTVDTELNSLAEAQLGPDHADITAESAAATINKFLVEKYGVTLIDTAALLADESASGTVQ